jgi:hypothetical protein
MPGRWWLADVCGRMDSPEKYLPTMQKAQDIVSSDNAIPLMLQNSSIQVCPKKNAARARDTNLPTAGRQLEPDRPTCKGHCSIVELGKDVMTFKVNIRRR